MYNHPTYVLSKKKDKLSILTASYSKEVWRQPPIATRALSYCRLWNVTCCLICSGTRGGAWWRIEKYQQRRILSCPVAQDYVQRSARVPGANTLRATSGLKGLLWIGSVGSDETR